MAWEMTANSGGGTEKAPPGNHMAVLVAIIDLGTQESQFDDVKSQHKVYLVWELTAEPIAGAKRNHVIAAAVTLSLNEKATLRKWVEARTGKPIPDGARFDITSELGQPCFLNVVLGDKGYPRVGGVTAVPRGIPVPTPTYPLTAVSLSEFRAGKPIPDFVPWLYGVRIEEHINASEEIGKPRPRPKRTEGSQTATATAENGSVDDGEPIPF